MSPPSPNRRAREAWQEYNREGLTTALTGWEMIRLLIFLLAAAFGDTRNPTNASRPIWLHDQYSVHIEISLVLSKCHLLYFHGCRHIGELISNTVVTILASSGERHVCLVPIGVRTIERRICRHFTVVLQENTYVSYGCFQYGGQ